MLARRYAPRILAALSPFLVTFVASTAHADPVADAKDLFEKGRELRAGGDCASAVALFRKAHDIYPQGLGSLRNLAECDEALGKFASARRAWLDLARALVQNEERKYAGWARDAAEAAARLASKTSTLIVDLALLTPSGATASADRVELSVNGEALAPGLIGTPLERDPGTYEVRVAGARVSHVVHQTVDLAAGETRRVSVRAVVEPEALFAEQAPKTGSATRPLAWTAMGLGTASLVGAAVAWSVRQSALDSLKSECGPSFPTCDQAQRSNLESIADRGRTAGTLADVFAILGAASIAAGVVLFAVSPSQGRVVVTGSPGKLAVSAWF
jgi:hypothetical protein